VKILHVCNWCSGITTRNVAALKQWSHHKHELLTRIIHPYDMACEPTHLTERDTTREMVLQLAQEADALHFHAVGYAGSVGLPETIHGIDWSQFLGNKKFIFHGMCADLAGHNGKFIPTAGNRFLVPDLERYDALMGPHFSCKSSYEERLHVVPDIIPINDWLYTPQPEPKKKKKITCSFKDPWVAVACVKEGISFRLFPCPTKMTEQLAWRRANCRVTFNGSINGAWGLFALESLSQGIPSVCYIHDEMRKIWDILHVPPPPFIECEYGGGNAPELLRAVMDMPEDEWQALSRKCRTWMEVYYNPGRLVDRWDAVYDTISRQ
jgi:hypothetical protein